jgi:hypothetical protein
LVCEDPTGDGLPLHSGEIVTYRTYPVDDVLRPGVTLRVEFSPNVGSLSITSNTRNPAYWTAMTRGVKSRRGFALDELASDLIAQGESGAVSIQIWYELYGGKIGQTEVIFT